MFSRSVGGTSCSFTDAAQFKDAFENAQKVNAGVSSPSPTAEAEEKAPEAESKETVSEETKEEVKEETKEETKQEPTETDKTEEAEEKEE